MKFVYGGGGALSQACALSQSGSTQGMSKYIFKKITLYLIFLLTSPFKLSSLLYSVSSFYLTTRGLEHEIRARGRGVPSARCAHSVTSWTPVAPGLGTGLQARGGLAPEDTCPGDTGLLAPACVQVAMEQEPPPVFAHALQWGAVMAT